MEAGQYAPNAGGQAWHFTAVRKGGLLKKLNLAAKEAARQADMKHLRMLSHDETFDCLYGAPMLVIVSADTRAPMLLDTDCAAATENMLIAAESLGLNSCWIYFVLMAFEGEQGAALLTELKIPEGYRPYSAAVFGYGKGEPVPAEDRKPGAATIIG